MCNCKNVDFGTYKNTTILQAPKHWTSKYKTVEIDTCIVDEIKELWEKGIDTLASCCGHNKIYPTILVAWNSIEDMKKLGYKQVGARTDMFFAKSIKFNPYPEVKK